MSRFKGTIVVDTNRCKGCGICVVACPQKVITLGKKVNASGYNYAVAAGDGCIGCASCGIVCPDGCITVYRKKNDE